MNHNASLTTITCQALKELWLHVLYECNLSCQHCLFACAPGKKGAGELSWAECRDLVLAARAEGVETIYITGGEPLLWTSLRQFLDWYYSLEQVLPLTILTNGTLITEDMASLLSKYAAQGLTVRVSLECYTPQTNDQFRGEGSFAQAIEGISNLNATGMRPWVAFVNKSGGSIASSDMRALEGDFIAKLAAEYGLRIAGLKVIAAYAKGRFEGCVEPTVTKAQIEEKSAMVQCAYGVAVSKSGAYPCPILVDIPEARLEGSLGELIGQLVELSYDVCASCFATGSTCGQ